MTNLPTTRRRRLTQVFAIGAVTAGALVAVAAPAQAAGTTAYHVAGTHGAGSRVVSNPGADSAATIATLADGTALTIDCGVRGRSVHRDNVWHHITSPVNGYIANYYTDTRRANRLISGEATCSATKPVPAPTQPTPANPSAPVATRGATINYNEGYAGSCVFYAMDRFHKLTGVYPKALGDAKYLADSAASSGWTVSVTPRVDSIAVFQPGQNGASGPTGHAAWVEQISGDRIYIGEMNAPTSGVITHRWLTPVAGVRYIYAA
jgi:surface antigen